MIERLFHVRAAGSTVGREVLGGLTTFLTMAYIVVVNPVFLTAAGMPLGGAVLATCLAAALGTFLMAFLANYPVALAPGMGLNAFFTYTICLGAGVPWPTALGLVFWAGLAFVLLSVTGARRVLVRAVPETLRLAGAVGIGLFIAFIGLQQGQLVVADPNTLVAFGDLASPPALLALAGLAFTFVLTARKVKTAIFLGLAASLVTALALGMVPVPDRWLAMPDAATLPGLSIDLWGALKLEYVPLMLVMLFFAVFDTLGTLMGIAHEGGFLKNGELPRLDRALLADSLGMAGGALAGSSTVTSYVESGAGVGVGARTGLANVVTGCLFLLAPFATPVVAVGGQGLATGVNPVTAPALVAVGLLMVGAVREIRWNDVTEAAPAFLTALLMPLTFSISHGLAAGVVTYTVVKIAAGRGREVHWLMVLLTVAFLLGPLWLLR